ncbi:bleomycin resistance protein [Paracoccus tegillarcae]|uniref:Bleomycin resistance protein n=1 Tax=Paracoccus tegillarcae TaxID=1529068 RepID=A0A2K9F4P9_9RHOB|nr:bleomycin resistance protein [Paracoccus tegillarcae]AUH34121.1 bleomycin resistance protein [Paracoccus tegillarcae]
MALTVTANLPSRDFTATEAFYGRLGFTRSFRDEGWMILNRDQTIIEFFPHPELDPATSWFSACFRTDDLNALLQDYAAIGLPSDGIPRLTGLQRITDDLRMFAVIDLDGSLIRCIGP